MCHLDLILIKEDTGGVFWFFFKPEALFLLLFFFSVKKIRRCPAYKTQSEIWIFSFAREDKP